MLHWLSHFFGLDDLTGAHYGFWSGVAGDVNTFTVPVAAYVVIRRHNCHVHRCPRVGRHKVDGTDWVVCRKHHPDDNPTHADVLAKAEEAND